MDIKVLGPGCAKCKKTAEIIKDALAETGVQAEVEKVTGLMDIAAYGVMGTPAVVIDGQVKLVGKVPKPDQVKAWLAE